jgi:hypothetical protein
MRRTVGLVVALVVAALPGCTGETQSSASPTQDETPTDDVTLDEDDFRQAIPRLVGLRLQPARTEAKASDFNVSVIRKKPSNRVPGTVLSQRPAAGRFRNPGTTIRVVVAKAKPQPPPPPPPNDYSPPIPPGPDVDCAGGSGDGPRYEGQGDVPFGPFQVVGTDIYGLDGDGNGTGCE